MNEPSLHFGFQCKKGDSIAQFLEKVRQQWHQLRGVNVDNLVFIKEDLIIPHHYTFYDFILNKSRGKSGPLFSFDVRDDVRLLLDASVETEEAHAGKVVERVWYERNKHIFPASRWEVFDPEKDYGKYTIKDLQKEKEASSPKPMLASQYASFAGHDDAEFDLALSEFTNGMGGDFNHSNHLDLLHPVDSMEQHMDYLMHLD
ncbi:hypothetical protein HDU93_004902, partial [Gonapodya sp. JEL0774]